jgi:hypothetical protein
MLSLLLDEPISHVVATQIGVRRPDISIQSIFHWRNGALVTRPDHLVLRAAAEDRLTLVTYDVTTIRPLLAEWSAAGIIHEGVIFIHQRTIRSDDFGRLVRALEQLWDEEYEVTWTNRIHFLRAP